MVAACMRGDFNAGPTSAAIVASLDRGIRFVLFVTSIPLRVVRFVLAGVAAVVEGITRVIRFIFSVPRRVVRFCLARIVVIFHGIFVFVNSIRRWVMALIRSCLAALAGILGNVISASMWALQHLVGFMRYVAAHTFRVFTSAVMSLEWLCASLWRLALLAVFPDSEWFFANFCCS